MNKWKFRKIYPGLVRNRNRVILVKEPQMTSNSEDFTLKDSEMIKHFEWCDVQHIFN